MLPPLAPLCRRLPAPVLPHSGEAPPPPPRSRPPCSPKSSRSRPAPPLRPPHHLPAPRLLPPPLLPSHHLPRRLLLLRHGGRRYQRQPAPRRLQVPALRRRPARPRPPRDPHPPRPPRGRAGGAGEGHGAGVGQARRPARAHHRQARRRLEHRRPPQGRQGLRRPPYSSRGRPVAKRTSVFDDPTLELQELTAVVKKDIGALNNAVMDLQALCNSRNDSNLSKDTTAHSTNVVDNLKNRLMSATKEFKEVLTSRTENLKVHENKGKCSPPQLRRMHQIHSCVSVHLLPGRHPTLHLQHHGPVTLRLRLCFRELYSS